MYNERKGISLVALIITIIVLIILTGTVIITMNQGNIIGKSEEAVFKSDLTNFRDEAMMKILNEQAKMKIISKSEVNATYDPNLIKEDTANIRYWLPSITDKYVSRLEIENGNLYYIDKTNEEEFKWAADIGMVKLDNIAAGKVQVGDYIEYIPGNNTYVARSQETGWNEDYTFNSLDTQDRERDLIWRVLSVDGGVLTIVKENYVNAPYFHGKTGYDNAIEVLNKRCAIYKNDLYATNARCITVEDINKLIGFTQANIESYDYTEIEGHTNERYTFGRISSNGKYKSDYYDYKINSRLDVNDKKYSMLFGKGDCILASKTVYVSSEKYKLNENGEYCDTSFTLRSIYNDGNGKYYIAVCANGDLYTIDINDNIVEEIRLITEVTFPVVTLKATLDVSKNEGENSISNLWRIVE